MAVASVTLTQAKHVVEMSLKLRDRVRIPLMLWGQHGIGKTSIMRQIAETHDMNCVVLNLANQTPEDLLGQINGQGGYHRPKWMVEETDRPTIYFLDEMNRAPKYVLQCMFNFINEGRIHTHTIRQCDIVVGACNPPSEKYEVTEFEDEAFLSRFCHLEVHPEKNEFIAYLSSRVKGNIVQTAINNSKSIYCDKSFSVPWGGSSDNRNLERVAVLFEVLEDHEIERVGQLIITGLVGFDAAAVIIQTWRKAKELTFESAILKTSGEFEFSSDEIDVIAALNASAVNFLKAKAKNGKISLPKKQIDRIWEYIRHIPRDAQVAFIKMVTQQSCQDFIDIFEDEQFAYVDELFTTAFKNA